MFIIYHKALIAAPLAFPDGALVGIRTVLS
jgi:hypothetical protein